MNEIRIFQNEQFGQVRIAMNESNEPLFCLADVCKILDLRVDGVLPRLNQNGYNRIGVTDSMGRTQNAYFVNEKNLYRVIMRSDKEETVVFQDWVCDEVLPSIRKHGAYMTGETMLQMMQNPDNLIQLLTALKNEQERNEALRVQNDVNIKAVQEMQPKAEYFDTVLRSTTLIATDVIAAEMGISARKLNKFLCEAGVQFKRGGTYVLYSDMRGRGFEGYKDFPYNDPNTGEVKTKKHMYWTEKGVYFIMSLYNGNICKQIN